MQEKNNFVLSGTIDNDFFKSYKFELKEELNIISGDNGSGQTTFLKSICDLKKNNGTILSNKKILTYDMFSYYFSGDVLGEGDMTIRENIFYNIGYGDKGKYKYYNELLRRFNLEDYENILYKNASEGMKQKVHIIICLLNEARIIILDEPFNYLDKKTCLELVLCLQEYQKNNRALILIATNELAILKSFRGKIFYLDMNKMLE